MAPQVSEVHTCSSVVSLSADAVIACAVAESMCRASGP